MPAADDDEVELVLGERLERVLAADHGRYVTNSSGSGRAGGGCSCRFGPRWISPRKRSSSPRPTAAQPGGGAQDARRAPVVGEPARVRAEQHDVDRARRRAEVLLVLLAGRPSARRSRRRAWARGRACAASGPGAGLQPLARLGAEHAEAPRARQVVVGRPARELEQLVERRAVDRLGAVDLVRAAGPDRLVELHGEDGIDLIDHAACAYSPASSRSADSSSASSSSPTRRSWTRPGSASRRSCPAPQLLSRAVGARDLTLGAGGLQAAIRGDGSAQQWLAAAAVCDAVDFGATYTAGRGIPRSARTSVLGSRPSRACSPRSPPWGTGSRATRSRSRPARTSPRSASSRASRSAPPSASRGCEPRRPPARRRTRSLRRSAPARASRRMPRTARASPRSR